MRVAALALALICGNAVALSLGEPELESYLGEALKLSLPVRGLPPGDAGHLRVRGLTEAENQRQAFVPVLPPSAFRSDVVHQDGGRARVVIRGTQPLHDPVVRLYLEVLLGDTRIIRRVDLLLDPQPAPRSQSQMAPATTAEPRLSLRATSRRPATRNTNATIQDGAATQPAPAQPPLRTADANPEPNRVRRGDTLSAIAERLQRPEGAAHDTFVRALQLANPEAFAKPGDPRTLRVGTQLRMPDAQQLQQAQAKPLIRPSEQASDGRGLEADTSAIFMAPGMFALQTRFNSYREQRAQQLAGALSVQAGEPPRFRADWVLDTAAVRTQSASAVSATSSRQERPAPTSTPVPQAPTRSPSPRTALPVSEPEPEREPAEARPPMPTVAPKPQADTDDSGGENDKAIESTVQVDDWGDEAYSEFDSPAKELMEPPVVMAANESEQEAEGSSWLTWSILLLLAGGAYFVWRQRENRQTITVESNPAPAETPPAPSMADTEPHLEEATTSLSAEARELLNTITKFQQAPHLSEAEHQDLIVAEAMVRRDRLDGARQILAQFESDPLA